MDFFKIVNTELPLDEKVPLEHVENIVTLTSFPFTTRESGSALSSQYLVDVDIKECRGKSRLTRVDTLVDVLTPFSNRSSIDRPFALCFVVCICGDSLVHSKLIRVLDRVM